MISPSPQVEHFGRRRTPQIRALPSNPLPSAIEEICDRAMIDLAKDFRLTFGIDLPHYQFPPDTQTAPAQPVPPTAQTPFTSSTTDKPTHYTRP